LGKQYATSEEEEEEDIDLTQININHGNSTPTVTEPGCQKTRRSTMATHRIQKLLTYIQKKTKTKTKKTYKLRNRKHRI